MFGFISITLADVVDIILVALLIYQFFKLIRGTAAINIFLGIISLYFLWLIVQALNMNLISSILGQVLGVGVIALIIIFQQEIRRFLIHLGNRYITKSRNNIFSRIFFMKGSEEIPMKSLEDLTQACSRMADTKTGALIILSHTSRLEFVVETGDVIDSRINCRLIENIFWKNTPLHDGAMIITGDRIVAARCTLPIVENPNIPAQYGMRHRAAVSITLETDADAIVVSEETGGITFVSNGEMKTMTSISELKLSIENSYRNNVA